MPDFSILGHWPLSSILILAVATFVAGLARGFSGFGAGLILMPVASAVLDPLLAVAVFSVADFVVAAPMLPNALRRADWPTVAPAAIAAVICVPFGVLALVHTDPNLVRWAISAITLAMLMLLVSGWRYRARPHLAATLGVGAVAGFLSGIAQVPGPPIVTYWMSGPSAAASVRANLIAFFLFTSLISLSAYLLSGLMTPTAIMFMILSAPIYGSAIWIGARLHGHAPENIFRTVVYALILLAALSSVPALDAIFGRG